MLILSGVLPLFAVGTALSAAFYLVRRRLFLLAPVFVAGNLWISWMVLKWAETATPFHGIGDYGPSIMSGLAGGAASLAISAAMVLALLLLDNHRNRPR